MFLVAITTSMSFNIITITDIIAIRFRRGQSFVLVQEGTGVSVTVPTFPIAAYPVEFCMGEVTIIPFETITVFHIEFA
jgi:hypothetical protein